MPELPEVETTLRGITPHLKNNQIQEVIIRHPRLRWPVPQDLTTILRGQTFTRLWRRGKYLLLETRVGTLILHLGMSGSVKVLESFTPPKKHDHFDIRFANERVLRLTDPRRFGAVLWTTEDPLNHPLLKKLGVEPLDSQFTGHYLWTESRKRKVPIKAFIMNSQVVVGVGNIYAAESLYLAKLHPQKPAGKINEAQYDKLAKSIRTILESAILQGGTTLKDFSNSEGKPGYFKVKLKVYGRGGMPCMKCKTTLKEIRLGQRSTVFCPQCQAK